MSGDRPGPHGPASVPPAVARPAPRWLADPARRPRPGAAGPDMRALQLSSKIRLMVLVATMALVVTASDGLTIWQLYRAALTQQRLRLVELAQNQARVIEAVTAAHGDVPPREAFQAALAPIADAHERYSGLGDTGEFTLAYRDGDLARFLLSHRHADLDRPEPVPLDSHLAAPMRQALAGASGTIVGLDYRGEVVLAAYEPVALSGLTVGVVAKIDLAEIRAPFWKAGATSALFGLGIVCFGALLFWYFGAPMLKREATERRFRERLLESAPDAIVICDLDGTIVLVNEQAETLFGYRRAELLGREVEMLIPKPRRDAHRRFRADFGAIDALRPMGEGRDLVGLTKDGRELPVAVNLSSIETDAGRVVAAAVRDISESKAALAAIADSKLDLEAKVAELQDLRSRLEQQATHAVEVADELSTAKALLSDAVESISEGFSLWGADERLIMCNERYRRMYPGLGDLLLPGLSFETFLSTAYGRGAIHSSERDREAAIIQQLRRHRSPVSVSELQLGDGRWVRVSKRKTKAGHVVGILTDVSERKESEATIKRMALEDSLTHLPNRKLFQERLEEALATADRTGRIVGLMLLDLDHFKKVNDTFGHPVGDEFLKQVSHRLFNCLRVTDTLARLGGDEFAVIATHAKSVDDIVVLARRLVEAMAKPFTLESHVIYSSTSIGITVYPQDDGDTQQLMRNADLALYRTKEEGRGDYRLYGEEMDAELKARRELELDLRAALERDELHVVYQPLYDVGSGEIFGAEALLRWTHPRRGNVSPVEFIPLAEATRLIVPISNWLLEAVCGQIRYWRDRGLPPCRISINVSAVQFRQDDLVHQLTEVLDRHELDPHLLELEITESLAMEAGEETQAILERLKRLGVNLAIDDFGTGYSSLSRLKSFPVDRLKIDRSFVRDITTDRNDAAISTAVIRLAHSLDVKVIAEGVETAEHLIFLAEQGCDQVQGYFLSPPLAPEAFEEHLRSYDPAAMAPWRSVSVRSAACAPLAPGSESGNSLRNDDGKAVA